LQEGFDSGYALVGIPLGHELGFLRGHVAALHAFLSASSAAGEHIQEARDIMEKLATVRFQDIAPRDLEAEQHAREHLELTGEDLNENEELAERRRVEQLEDMMGSLNAGSGASGNSPHRTTVEDVAHLKGRLEALAAAVGIMLDPQRS